LAGDPVGTGLAASMARPGGKRMERSKKSHRASGASSF